MKIFLISWLSLLFITCNSVDSLNKRQKNSVPNILGTRLSETPVGKYIDNELREKTWVMIVAYACSHCKDQTKKIEPYLTEGLVDDVIVLGGAFHSIDSLRVEFQKVVGDNFTNYRDYEIKDFVSSLEDSEGSFNVPIGIYVVNGIVKNVFSRVMPSARAFQNYQEKSY